MGEMNNSLSPAQAEVCDGLERKQYTREEIAQRVQVPRLVEQELRRIVEDRLSRCGIYHRVFSRIKTPDSLEHKYQYKSYGDGRKIQDLVGIRIDLYFEDDVEICRKLMGSCFELVQWTSTESKEEEFKASKINGVFRLPEYLRARISPDTFEMAIDDTFEIQLKTMFFEGWHEIEHDMRYKQEDLWKDRWALSRYFNSILATLELCDKSMVSLFDDLGHDLYKNGEWAAMIRVHFHVKLDSQPLYKEVAELFQQSYDDKSEPDNIAKQLFKCPREVLIHQITKHNYNVPLNVNTVVALINECRIGNARLTKIFKERDVYNAGRIESQNTPKGDELKSLIGNPVFQAQVQLDTEKCGLEQAFEKAVTIIYQSIYNRFKDIFENLPEQPQTLFVEETGYQVGVIFDRDAWVLRTRTKYIDLSVGGRVWITKTRLRMTDGKIWFYTVNTYVEPEGHSRLEQGLYFNFPRFYREIADSIGIIDVVRCCSNRHIVKDLQIGEVLRVIRSNERKFPVVLIISKEQEDGRMDESWLGRFRVSDFTRSVWRYAHVYTAYEDSGRAIIEDLHCVETGIPGVFVFWPHNFLTTKSVDTCPYDYYSAADVENCSFGRHRETYGQTPTYDIVKGGQGFYHMLLRDIRDSIVSCPVDDDSRRMDKYYRAKSSIMKKPESVEEWEQLLTDYNAYNIEIISENQILRERIRLLEKELFRVKNQRNS